MRRLCIGIFGIVFVLLLAAPAGFTAQQQSQTQQQPATTGSSQPSQTQAQQQPAATDASQQPQTQDQTATSDEDETMKGVKPGSEKDVNSIGNRGVGKGVNLVFPAARDRARETGGHGSRKDRQNDQ